MGFFDSFLGSFSSGLGSGASSGLLGTLFSPFSTLLDSFGLSTHGRDQYFARDMQREFLNTQIEAQKESQQRNFDFSKQMYEQQWQDMLANYPDLLKIQTDEQFNLWKNQFQQENAYNNPSAQVGRMMQAGVNPAANNAVTTGINQMSPSSVAPPPVIHGSPLGGSVSPVGLPQGMTSHTLSELGSFIRDLSTVDLQGAQSIGQKLQNEITDKTLDAQIESVGLKNNWTKEQISLTQQQFAEMTAKLQKWNKELELTDKQIAWFDKEMTAKVGELKASKEYQHALAGYTDQQKELLNSMFDDLKDYQTYKTQQMSKFVDLLEKYGDAQAIVGMLSQVIGSATDVLDLFIPSKSVVKHLK